MLRLMERGFRQTNSPTAIPVKDGIPYFMCGFAFCFNLCGKGFIAIQLQDWHFQVGIGIIFAFQNGHPSLYFDLVSEK